MKVSAINHISLLSINRNKNNVQRNNCVGLNNSNILFGRKYTPKENQQKFQIIVQALYGDKDVTMKRLRNLLISSNNTLNVGMYLKTPAAKNHFCSFAQDGKSAFEVKHEDGKKEILTLDFDDILNRTEEIRKQEENITTFVTPEIKKRRFQTIVQILYTHDKLNGKMIEKLAAKEGVHIHITNYLTDCEYNRKRFNSFADENGKVHFEITHEDGTKEDKYLSFDDIQDEWSKKNSSLHKLLYCIIRKDDKIEQYQYTVMHIFKNDRETFGIQAGRGLNEPFKTKKGYYILPMNYAFQMEGDEPKKDENGKPILDRAKIKATIDDIEERELRKAVNSKSKKSEDLCKLQKFNPDDVDIVKNSRYSGSFKYNKETKEVELPDIPKVKSGFYTFCVLDLEKQKYAIYQNGGADSVRRNLNLNKEEIEKLVSPEDKTYPVVYNRFVVFYYNDVVDNKYRSQEINPEILKDVIRGGMKVKIANEETGAL